MKSSITVQVSGDTNEVVNGNEPATPDEPATASASSAGSPAAPSAITTPVSLDALKQAEDTRWWGINE